MILLQLRDNQPSEFLVQYFLQNGAWVTILSTKGYFDLSQNKLTLININFLSGDSVFKHHLLL
jgi:hypothetical protein